MRYIDVPAKVLEGNMLNASGIESWPYNDNSGDPFWAGGVTPKDYRWLITIEVTPQTHSSYKTRRPYTYDGMDVTVGDYIASQQEGVAVQIVSIQSKSTTSLTCIVEDTLRYNTFRSIGGSGNGIFSVGSIVIFELNQENLPIIDPVPPNGISANFYANIMSRFQNLEKNFNFLLHKKNHGFKIDDLISADSTTKSYVKADPEHPYIIGTVSYTDIGPDDFMVNPVQKIVDNFPHLIGDVGDVIYADNSSPGNFSLTGNHPIMIKLRNNTNSTVSGTTTNPSTTAGSTFNLNGLPVTVGGTGSASDFANAVNSNTVIHGVSASVLALPTIANSTLSNFSYGEPVGYIATPNISATINNVLVNFTTNTFGLAQYGAGYIVEEDMAFDINAANIPNITATTTSNNLIITNNSGGSITISNGNPDVNGKYFAGADSISGLPLSVSATTSNYVRLDAIDARAINLYDTSGSPTADFGLVSVENGIKAAALYIEQGVRQAATYVVSNIAARDSLNVMFGDQAYVQDHGNGEWGFYIYTLDNTWVKLADQDSAQTDAQSIEVIITPSTPSTELIHTISNGRRVSFITVTVNEAFDHNATVSVGDNLDNSRLMTIDQNDLTSVGVYSTTPSYVYEFGTDTNINLYFNANSSTVGNAIVAITYT